MYPYLPKGRTIMHVKPENRFMQMASEMLANSGCLKQPTAAVIVKKRIVLGKGVNAGKKVEVCPRVLRNCPTGTGYEFCKTVCEQEGHAEIMAIRNALSNGHNLKGASLYLDGHWWACKECWDKILQSGITKVFLRTDSVELYKMS